MNIQINGHRKSKDTRKTERFFSERRIPFHSRDLIEKPLSPREIENISRSVNPDLLIDTESAAYKKAGMEYMEYDPAEEVVEKPQLIRMPIVRNGPEATVGYAPDTWLRWIADDKR